MTKKNDTANSAGNKNDTGGSYKEKQPASKPSEGQGEQKVDDDGDGKADRSTSKTQKKTKTSS